MSSIKRDRTPGTPGRCENFLYVFKGAQSAPRGVAAAHAKAPRDETAVPSAAHRLSAARWALTAPVTLPAAGSAALRPCRTTAAPQLASDPKWPPRRTQRRRTSDKRAALQEGPSLRCPNPEALQSRGQARL